MRGVGGINIYFGWTCVNLLLPFAAKSKASLLTYIYQAVSKLISFFNNTFHWLKWCAYVTKRIEPNILCRCLDAFCCASTLSFNPDLATLSPWLIIHSLITFHFHLSPLPVPPYLWFACCSVIFPCLFPPLPAFSLHCLWPPPLSWGSTGNSFWEAQKHRPLNREHLCSHGQLGRGGKQGGREGGRHEKERRWWWRKGSMRRKWERKGRVMGKGRCRTSGRRQGFIST